MQRFRNILCVVAEADPAAESAVSRAVSLARNNQARLTVAAMVPELGRVPRLSGAPELQKKVESGLIAAADARLAQLIKPHTATLSIETAHLAGTPFLAAIRKVLQDAHDLVIKAPENPSWSDGLLGSDDMHLMRKCPCPVWLHRSGRTNSYRQILAAIDCEVTDESQDAASASQGPLNRLVFELASSIALAEGANLHLLHAWTAAGETMLRSGFAAISEDKIEKYANEVLQQNQAAADAFIDDMERTIGAESMQFLAPKTHLVKGWARDVIPDTAAQLDADLVVMGTVGRTGVPGLLIGNTAETVLRRLDCSILAVKPPGFRTPVTAGGR